MPSLRGRQAELARLVTYSPSHVWKASTMGNCFGKLNAIGLGPTFGSALPEVANSTNPASAVQSSCFPSNELLSKVRARKSEEVGKRPPAGIFKIISTRMDVTVPVFWMPHEGAVASVMLMPGGMGGFGDVVDDQPTSENFLVRSRKYFAEQDFNVAVIGRPIVGRSSHPDNLVYADPTYRTSAKHVDDLKQVVAEIKKWSNQPLWMIGTSRGTISTAAAGIEFGNDELAGIVLTSSIVDTEVPGAVPEQRLDAITIPVLVLHHEGDACGHCKPEEVEQMMPRLENAPIAKLMMVNGGAGLTGDPCGPIHFHGFIGMEKKAVNLIANWIKNPTI